MKPAKEKSPGCKPRLVTIKGHGYYQYQWTPYPGAKRQTVSDKDYDECVRKYERRQRLLSSGCSMETFGECFEDWLETDKKRTLSQNTYDTYVSTYKNHIESLLGKKFLQEVKEKDGLLVRNKMQDAGRSPTTIKHVFALLNQCMEHAVEEEKVLKNPFRKISLPKLQQEERVPYTDEEVKKILTYISSGAMHKLYNPCIAAGIHLLAVTGCRRSEMLGLTWDCLDFEEHAIRIRQTVVQDGKGNAVYKETTKTRSSNRTIYCDDDSLWNELKELPRHGKFVFSTKRGTHIIPRNFERAAKSIIVEAGVPYKGIHALRHYFVSLLVNHGVDTETIKSFTGHSTVAMIERYSHRVEETVLDTAKALGKHFGH